MKDRVTGKIVKGVPDPEYMRQMALKRHQKAREAARQGMLEGVKPIRAVDTDYDAWGVIIEKQTELATSPDASGSVSAAQFVGKATDMMGESRAVAERAQTTISIEIRSDAVAEALALRIAGLEDEDVD